MQGPVHDRVTILYETIQYGLLDRWQAAGASPQIVFEEPVFEDRTPSFVLAEKAQNIPLTRNQRLALVGEDPLPDYGPDGEPLGLAIDLPVSLQLVGQGEEPQETSTPGRFANRAPNVTLVPGGLSKDQAETVGMLIRAGFDPEESMRSLGLPPIKHVGLLPITLQTDPVEAQVAENALSGTTNMPPALPANVPSPAKAGGLPRASVLRRFEPLVEKAIRSFLTEQKHDIANRIRARGEHLARKPTDRSVWWSDKWDDKLLDALKVGVAGVSATVAAKVQSQLGAPAKAFSDTIAQLILRSVGRRITGINATTRDEIGRLIGEAFAQGLAPSQVAELIEEATPFNEARAELIARTETALAYNEAALESYREYGVDKVEAIDGDEDEECAARNGTIHTVEEALGITDHPQGTLDWAPVIA
jgi:hypothetical protein